MEHISYERVIVIKFEELLAALKELKPNDRSEQDRYWAITITETEKAAAFFKTYARGENYEEN